MTLCPACRRPCSNSPCHAVRPEIGRLAPTVKSTSPGSGARLRASIATYSASVPSRYQSARPNTRCPTDRPAVPYPRAVTTPASSCPGIDGVRSRPRRSVQVEGHVSSVGTNPDAWTRTTTSFIAACGSGRSTSFIPAVPAAWSVTTIAFMEISSIIWWKCCRYGACRSRTNADDRLPADPLGRIEGGDGVVEGRDVADVRPQPAVPHPLDDLTQLGAIGQDNKVDRQAVGRPRLGRPGDGHQLSSGSNEAYGPFPDVTAEDIEHQIDWADVFEGVVVEVDELLRAEVERLLTVGSASGADDASAGLTCELRHHRTDCAGRAVHEHALPRLKTAMLEQSLPRGQARHRHARAHREVDVARQRREVACLDGHILRQGAAAIRVREAEHPLSLRQSRRAVAESGDHAGQLLPRNNRRPVTAEAIGPGRGPGQLTRGESRRMNLNDDVVDRGLRVGQLHELHPGRPC